jgi:hypothetical protein
LLRQEKGIFLDKGKSEKTSPGALGKKEKVPVLPWYGANANTSKRFKKLNVNLLKHATGLVQKE